MTGRLSEDDIMVAVTRLTRRQLRQFIEGDLVRPRRSAEGYDFHLVDVARLELLCDLSEGLDLEEPALEIVLSLIDQLHAARQDLATLARGIEALPDDLRAAVLAGVRRS